MSLVTDLLPLGLGTATGRGEDQQGGSLPKQPQHPCPTRGRFREQGREMRNGTAGPCSAAHPNSRPLHGPSMAIIFLFRCQVLLDQEASRERQRTVVLNKCLCCAPRDPARPEKLSKRQRTLPLGPKHTFLTRQRRSPNSFPLKCNPTARGFVYSKARWTAAQKLVSPCALEAGT